MKALLINPPTGLYVREDRCQSSVNDFAVTVPRPPMDLMMMAASLETMAVECKIKDYPIIGGDWLEVAKEIERFSPDLLIVSITSPTLKEDLQACALAKKHNPRVLTIAKGAHFLNYDRETLRDFDTLDLVIRGESELVIKEIVSRSDLAEVAGISYRRGGEIVRNKDREWLRNLDELPVPARHLVPNNLYTRPDTGEPLAVIETSRGCPGQCIYCLVKQVSGNRIRHRSVPVILNEIIDCLDNYQISNFHFKADTFTWDKKWVMALCAEIINRGIKIKWLCNSRVDSVDEETVAWMRRAGCWAMGLGIESGSQEILDKIKKGTRIDQAKYAVGLCKKYGLKTYAYFMIGFPWDNQKTVMDSIKFAQELDPDFIDYFIPYPFPGTELEKVARDYGLLNTAERTGRAYAEPITSTLSLSREDLHDLRKKGLRSFYLRPKYVMKKLRQAGSINTLGRYLYYGVKILLKTG